jgi:MerR family redox-sensitive transcriptional activator SoxR
MPALLTIGEVARCTGVSTSAIRYYEEAGLLPEPERVGGKRRYEKEILRRLALIRGAKGAGFTLGEIRHPPARLSRRDWGSGTLAGARFEKAG